ncbi:alpha/beta hydrolase [Yeosuana marina]|uniref:alpha/beta hydrolase n=1 Tax=Yeosuana marina TaxID=1565536 RepID=UPI0030C7C366
MKILKKIGKWILFLLGGIIGIILIVLLIIRINSSGVEEPFLDEHSEVLPNSIAMHEDKIINGVPQRLTIRGKDINNPVLLQVHGGPGGHMPPVLHRLLNIDLEDLFTVCYWEQRGSGSAYYLHADKIPDSTITLKQIVDDGLEITDYLKQKFNKDKIYIEGISWGTTVSAFMVQKRPELYQAYIGIGQMANQPLSEQMSYDFVMNEALKQNDTASINQLKQIGRPPYPNKTAREMADACDIERLIVNKYAPPQRDPFHFNIIKNIFLDNGLTFKEKFAPAINPQLIGNAYWLLWPTCFNINLMRDVPEWKIPVYIIQGENDHYTETSLAKEYFDSIKAPEKKWFLFKDAWHAANFDFPEKYRSIYINEILKK